MVSCCQAIDLAIRLKAKTFISHRYCQFMITKRWTGSAPGSLVPLGFADDTVAHWKIIMKMVLPFPLAARIFNQLGMGDWIAAVTENPHGRMSGVARSVVDVYHIPVVKFWSRTLVTYVGFAIWVTCLLGLTNITLPGALSLRPAGAQAVMELGFATWTLGMACDWVERGPARRRWAKKGLRPSFALIDSSSLAVLLCLCGIRTLFLVSEPDPTGVIAAWVFPFCLAVCALLTFFRFIIESLLVYPSLGVLTIIIREMVTGNLLKWAVTTSFVLAGFGLAFTALVPSYTLSDEAPAPTVDIGDSAGQVTFTGPGGPSMIGVWVAPSRRPPLPLCMPIVDRPCLPVPISGHVWGL